ncbi:hypothetical protein COW96_01275 [Candidatus Roizmanbacteria bacterium CG22_combo_CG10-13_8_21_14_all_33_16]|uniref:Uncharacterized protein n=1 Tax=Candidatus Roizmanbacteria bacterium CG22_combo_CG10-13_8_21_14_all_33_16 TaxID=1974859 RepID=A0A2H0C422_9BACT|nr:MAG: hypothetical protein COW96_01275 [Candidatus Roizmanbacteria bacterium CG22_combo_CG10-13_8_21_14_all_33_16]
MTDIEHLEQLAIEAALKSEWKSAIVYNLKILEIEIDVSALLRLGYINFKIGNWKEARKHYQKALKIQPLNHLARINLEKVKILEKKGYKNNNNYNTVDLNQFLEITGKTKNVHLVNVGQKNIIAALTIGQPVNLIQKKRKIEVRTVENEYVGSLPDDLSKRLSHFIKANSIYEAFVKESDLTYIVIFIREVKKGKRVANYLSFPRNIQSQLNKMGQDEKNDQEDDSEEEVWDDEVSDVGRLENDLEEDNFLPVQSEDDEE